MMHNKIKLTTPLSIKDIENLKIGDNILLNGIIYTARDSAHKRLSDLIISGKELPININGQVIYYAGPSPAKPDKPIGSAGPTTSYRMDAYAPKLIELGLKGMIGKGQRSREVIDAMIKYKAAYFGATGGAGALISRSIRKSEIVAYDDLGPEAIHKFEVVDFPLIVINDINGNDLYLEGVKKYKKVNNYINL